MATRRFPQTNSQMPRGRSLLRDPRLLIVDEPSNGLDPAGIRDMRALIKRLGESGLTVLLSGTSRGCIERRKRSPAAFQSTPRSASLARISTNAMPCSTCTDASGRPSRRCSRLPAAPKPPNRIATGMIANGD